MNPLAGLSEADFQRQVMRIATDFGWLVCHVGRARVGKKWVTPTSVAGFPDLVLVRPPQLVFLELKRLGGRARPEQLAWISALQRCDGVEAYVVDPADADEVWSLLAQPNAAR